MLLCDWSWSFTVTYLPLFVVQSLSCIWLFVTPWLPPGVCSKSSPLSWWCHPIISSSVTPFSSCIKGPTSFAASRSFPISWHFTSGGQSVGVSVSASVLPMNIQGWFPFGLTGWISAVQGTLKSLLQHHSSKTSILQPSAFFIVQFSHPYMTTGKNIALTI